MVAAFLDLCLCVMVGSCAVIIVALAVGAIKLYILD